MSDFLTHLKAEVVKTKQMDRKGLTLLKAVAMHIEQNRKDPEKLQELADALRAGGNELVESVNTPTPEPVDSKVNMQSDLGKVPHPTPDHPVLGPTQVPAPTVTTGVSTSASPTVTPTPQHPTPLTK